MTTATIVRTLLGKLHILIISLLLVSFALGSAETPQFNTYKSAPAKPQSITRLSSAPTNGPDSADDNSVVSAPKTTSESSVEAQNTDTAPQQSISNMQSGTLPPATVVTPPATTVVPCNTYCDDTPLLPTTPGPIGSCGCGGPTYYGYQPQRTCPMIDCAM